MYDVKLRLTLCLDGIIVGKQNSVKVWLLDLSWSCARGIRMRKLQDKNISDEWIMTARYA
jgi:hypothetical protein